MIPAAWAAWRYLLTTPSERRSAPAIWRCESPASYLSRSRSLSLRIEIGGADIESPFHDKRKKEMVSLKSPNLQRCRRVTKTKTEIRRRLKKCSRWTGFGVHDAPDSVFTMGRIRRSRWPGKCRQYCLNEVKRNPLILHMFCLPIKRCGKLPYGMLEFSRSDSKAIH